MQIIDDYIAWKGIIHAPAQYSYRHWLEMFFKIIPKSVEEITEHDVGTYKRILEEKYSRTTVRYTLIVLKNFFRYCRVKGIECIDPWLIKIPQPLNHPFVAATEDEIQKMIEAIDNTTFSGVRDTTIVHMLADTGVRVGELCALNLADISLTREWTVIKTGKNQQSRPIYWSSFTHEWLKEYIEQRIIFDHPALFIHRDTGHGVGKLSTRAVQRLFVELRKKAGIEAKITPHSMRHHRAQEVGEIEHIAEILGHKSIESSRNYLRFRNEKLQAIAMQTLTKNNYITTLQLYDKQTKLHQHSSVVKKYWGPTAHRIRLGKEWEIASQKSNERTSTH